jgi:hypothetical protein
VKVRTCTDALQRLSLRSSLSIFSFLFFFSFFLLVSLFLYCGQYINIPLSLIPHSLSIPRLLFWPGGPRTLRKMVGKLHIASFAELSSIFISYDPFLSHFPSSQPKISLSRYPEILIQLLCHQTHKLSVNIPTFLPSPVSTISFPNYPRHPSLSTTLPPMGQIISVIQQCLPLCFPLPESEDQNEASQVVGVQDPNEDGTVSTILKNSYTIYIYIYIYIYI